MSTPQYDLVLLGPTGYTGRFCAEHIVKNHPTSLKWAIAGRSAAKMEPIAQELKKLNQDRVQPGMDLCSLLLILLVDLEYRCPGGPA